jgi:hypothetical protein
MRLEGATVVVRSERMIRRCVPLWVERDNPTALFNGAGFPVASVAN